MHLIIVVFLIAVPAIILIILSGREQRSDVIKEGISVGKKLVFNLATKQHDLSIDVEQVLTILAQIPDVKKHKVHSVDEILANILKNNPHYGNIVISDRNGNIWASGLPLKNSLPLINWHSFINALTTKQFSSGEYSIGRISKVPSITFSYPIITKKGDIDCIISANINYKQFHNDIVNLDILKEGIYRVMDHNGVIIDTNLDPAKYIGTKIENNILLNIINGPDKDAWIIRNQEIFAYRKIQLNGESSPYIYIQADLPLKKFLTKATRAQFQNIAVLSFFLMAPIGMGMFMGNRFFLKRIRVLQEASTLWAEGNLQVRIADKIGDGELGSLGKAFDDMAGKLAYRESSLIKSKQEYTDLYNNAPCGYHSLNAAGIVVRMNNTELSWLGYTWDEVVGKKHITDLITTDGHTDLESSFTALKEQGLAIDLEFNMIRKDGLTFPVLINSSGVFDEKGSFLMSLNTASDITDSVKTKRELNELNLKLAKRIDEETERRLKHERLLARHARLAAMGEMIGAIAHQWRQPLTSIIATIQTIRMAWERGCIDDAFLENAEIDAQKQINYMSETIDDFRNFFTPDKVIEQFDIKNKIQEVVLLVSAQFANSGVKILIENNSSDMPLPVRGYPNEFKQAVLNLVSNACDAILEKESQHRMSDGKFLFNGLVIISMANEVDKIIIEVRDNGIGIPLENTTKIFEPYFTSKSEGKGTGIGLYMSKLIVEESMGGRLSFISNPESTTFKIELACDVSSEAPVNE
jgi:PAS domain S-box-containing protein